MTNTLYCPFCIGKGKYQSMGMIEKKCDHCNGVGYVEAGSKLEEKPNGDTSTPVKTVVLGVDPAIPGNDESVVVALNKEGGIAIAEKLINVTDRYGEELKLRQDEVVPVELIASKRRGRPPRTEK